MVLILIDCWRWNNVENHVIRYELADCWEKKYKLLYYYLNYIFKIIIIIIIIIIVIVIINSNATRQRHSSHQRQNELIKGEQRETADQWDERACCWEERVEKEEVAPFACWRWRVVMLRSLFLTIKYFSLFTKHCSIVAKEKKIVFKYVFWFIWMLFYHWCRVLVNQFDYNEWKEVFLKNRKLFFFLDKYKPASARALSWRLSTTNTTTNSWPEQHNHK